MPVEFVYNTKFKFFNEPKMRTWLNTVAASENSVLGNITYAFFNDSELKKINKQFLNHNVYTDVISFDNSKGQLIEGDIAISTERVKENAKKYDVLFEEELKRVMVHGLLHFLGYNDKTEEERKLMESKENSKLKLFHEEPRKNV
jgi:rRNA maturation RNase YbeY